MSIDLHSLLHRYQNRGFSLQDRPSSHLFDTKSSGQFVKEPAKVQTQATQEQSHHSSSLKIFSLDLSERKLKNYLELSSMMKKPNLESFQEFFNDKGNHEKEEDEDRLHSIVEENSSKNKPQLMFVENRVQMERKTSQENVSGPLRPLNSLSRRRLKRDAVRDSARIDFHRLFALNALNDSKVGASPEFELASPTKIGKPVFLNDPLLRTSKSMRRNRASEANVQVQFAKEYLPENSLQCLQSHAPTNPADGILEEPKEKRLRFDLTHDFDSSSRSILHSRFGASPTGPRPPRASNFFHRGSPITSSRGVEGVGRPEVAKPKNFDLLRPSLFRVVTKSPSVKSESESGGPRLVHHAQTNKPKKKIKFIDVRRLRISLSDSLKNLASKKFELKKPQETNQPVHPEILEEHEFLSSQNSLECQLLKTRESNVLGDGPASHGCQARLDGHGCKGCPNCEEELSESPLHQHASTTGTPQTPKHVRDRSSELQLISDTFYSKKRVLKQLPVASERSGKFKLVKAAVQPPPRQASLAEKLGARPQSRVVPAAPKSLLLLVSNPLL